MSTAAAPTPTSPPSPTGITTASRAGQIIGLLHRLIVYGRELAAALRQHGLTPQLAETTRGFGTRDIALILARITRGLLRADALEARLARHAGRVDRQPPRPSAAARSPRPARTASRQPDADAALVRLPTPEQIAAQVRRRPVGAVIADICRDLGITPSHPLWPELRLVVMLHGGSLATLLKGIFQDMGRLICQAADRCASVPDTLAGPAHRGTGPP